MKIFNKLFNKIKKDKSSNIISNLESIKDEIINDIINYTMIKLEQDANLIMTEETEEGLHAYPLIDEDLHKLVVYKYGNIYERNTTTEEQIIINNWVDELIYSNDLSLKLGNAYNKSYHEWEDEYYKDADSIEEEMWRFENEGVIKYKGFIEQSLEKAEEFNGHINYDITPELLPHEQTIRPYIEHEEDPNEVVSLEDGDIELIEIVQDI